MHDGLADAGGDNRGVERIANSRKDLMLGEAEGESIFEKFERACPLVGGRGSDSDVAPEVREPEGGAGGGVFLSASSVAWVVDERIKAQPSADGK